MRRIAKGCVLALLCAICVTMLFGCADAREIDDTAFVLSLGVDKGEQKAYRFTFQIPYFNDSNQIGEQARFHSIVCQAQSLEDAIELVDANSAYQLDLSHLNFLVFGQSLAQQGVGKIVTHLMQSAQAKQGAMVIVSMGGAEAFLKGLEADKETNLEKLQQSMIDEAKEAALFAHCTLAMLHDSIREGRSDIVCALGARSQAPQEQSSDEAQRDDEGGTQQAPDGALQPDPIPQMGQGAVLEDWPGQLPLSTPVESHLLGSVYFAGDQLCGKLSGLNTRLALLARDAFVQGHFMIPPELDGQTIAVRIQRARGRRVTVDTQQQIPRVRIELFVKAHILSTNSGQDKRRMEDEQMQEQIRAYLQAQLTLLAQQAQQSGVDLLELGKQIKGNFATNAQWKAYRMADKWAQTPIEISVQVEIVSKRVVLGGE